MSFLTEVAGAIGAAKVTTRADRLRRLPRDFYWYSQVLDARLRGCVADCAVFPEGEDDVVAVVALAAEHGSL